MSILIIKVATATAVVLGLSVLAERLGPRLAGVLMGAPLGALIDYYLSARGAPNSLPPAHTLLGMTGTLMFTYAYCRTSVWCKNSPHSGTHCAAAAGVENYFTFGAVIKDSPSPFLQLWR